MPKDFSSNFWVALGAVAGMGLLLYGIFTSLTTDFVKEIAFTMAMIGVLYLYIQFVIIGRIVELEKKRKKR